MDEVRSGWDIFEGEEKGGDRGRDGEGGKS